jgi:hypothetical protein
MPDFTGGVLASDDTLPLSSEDEGGHPGSHPPGEFNTPDEEVPTVSFDPLSGNDLDPDEAVTVDVVDPVSGDIGGILRVIILIVYDSGVTELVYTGTAFTAGYSSSSTTPITDGTQYEITRDDDWLDDFQMRVYVTDTGANEPASQPSTADYTVPDGIGSPDETPAVIDYVPAGGDNTLTVGEVVNVDVTDEFGIADIAIWLEYTVAGVLDIVYAGGAAQGEYSVTPSGIIDGTRYAVSRGGDGWLEDFTLYTQAFDTSGNTSQLNDDFDVPAGVGAGTDDNVAPEVTVISPAEGSPINADTPLVIEVTDDVDLVVTPLYAEFPGAPCAEMVYQGTTSVGGTPTNAGFLAPYVELSTVVDVAGGIRLTLRRTGGWPGAVTLTIIPVDGGGNAP